jgi:hypothetical protein
LFSDLNQDHLILMIKRVVTTLEATLILTRDTILLRDTKVEAEVEIETLEDLILLETIGEREEEIDSLNSINVAINLIEEMTIDKLRDMMITDKVIIGEEMIEGTTTGEMTEGTKEETNHRGNQEAEALRDREMRETEEMTEEKEDTEVEGKEASEAETVVETEVDSVVVEEVSEVEVTMVVEVEIEDSEVAEEAEEEIPKMKMFPSDLDKTQKRPGEQLNYLVKLAKATEHMDKLTTEPELMVNNSIMDNSNSTLLRDKHLLMYLLVVMALHTHNHLNEEVFI